MKLSFSSISNFLNCPKKFYEVNVAYNWRDSTPRTLAGSDVHLTIETYIKSGDPSSPLPFTTERIKKKLQECQFLYKAMPKGKTGCETQFAVDENFNQVPWNSPKAILRGKTDFFAEGGKVFSITDWKSGKKRDNKLQAKVYGVLVSTFTAKPVRCTFDYLDNGVGDVHELTKDDIDSTKELVHYVLSAKDFPARENPLCGWCPVRSCPFWKDRSNNG